MNLDLNNSRTLTILVIVVLILFAIVYVWINRDGLEKDKVGSEGYVNYPVGVSDVVQLQGGLNNVQVGSNNTPLPTSINNLIQQALNNVVPPLSIVSFYGTTAPIGWQFCDGTPLTDTNGKTVRITGTTNPFSTPNLQGRIIVGVNSGTAANGGASLDMNGVNISAYKLGQTGGEEKHKLIISEMPLHNHNPFSTLISTTVSGGNLKWWAPNSDSTIPQGNTTLVGGDQPHNIMQPYYVLAYIIKQPSANIDNSFVSLPNQL